MSIEEIFKCDDKSGSQFISVLDNKVVNGKFLLSSLWERNYDYTISMDDRMVILKNGKQVFIEML